MDLFNQKLSSPPRLQAMALGRKLLVGTLVPLVLFGQAACTSVGPAFASAHGAREAALFTPEAKCGNASQGWGDFASAGGGKVRVSVDPDSVCASWYGYESADAAIAAMRSWCDANGKSCEIAYTAGPRETAVAAAARRWLPG